MNDLFSLLPHSKKEGKLDSKHQLDDINELAELNNCNNCLYFEVRKHQDMFMWMSKTPNGPSVKFQVKNVHTMDELKLTGNCLKGSRPILSFDSAFDSEAHLGLIKEMFIQTFGVPKTSRKIKPFIDHVMSFTILDDKIWMRNYQIVIKDNETSLVEIGPRMVLEIIRIFDQSFGGSTLYENNKFISPNALRRLAKEKMNKKYAKRQESLANKRSKLTIDQLPNDPLGDVFE